MSATNRILVMLLLAVAAAAVFWFLMLSPKREEIATLDAQIAQLHSSIASSEQAYATGMAAKENFSQDYSQLVTLGKAVPDGDEQAALLVQLNRLGNRNNSVFTSISMEGSGAEPAMGEQADDSPATVEPSVTEPPSEEEATADPAAQAAATATPAPATADAVAALPLGATVGSAGFATIPYKLVYRGNFFKLADFIGALDSQVKTGDGGRMEVSGRLMTIDGFALNPADGVNLNRLNGNFSITTFATPASEGLLAGATPAGPGTGPTLVSNSSGGQ